MGTRAWIWLLLGFALWGGGAIVSTLPRGIRNNNPGNLRRSRDKFLGLADQQTDPEYFQFVSPDYGLRAMGIVLLNYESRHGLRTVRGIVSRYAPGHENPTDAYIANVAGRLRVAPDAVIDVRTRLPELMRAMAIQENGAAAHALHLPARVYDAALALIGSSSA